MQKKRLVNIKKNVFCCKNINKVLISLLVWRCPRSTFKLILLFPRISPVDDYVFNLLAKPKFCLISVLKNKTPFCLIGYNADSFYLLLPLSSSHAMFVTENLMIYMRIAHHNNPSIQVPISFAVDMFCNSVHYFWI